MLRYAQQRRQVTPTLADAAALPIALATVDAVLLAYVLFMMPDLAMGLHEATRVLRPGGTVGTVTWGSEEPSLAAKTWDATLEQLGIPALPAHSNNSGLNRRPRLDAVDRHGIDSWRCVARNDRRDVRTRRVLAAADHTRHERRSARRHRRRRPVSCWPRCAAVWQHCTDPTTSSGARSCARSAPNQPTEDDHESPG